MEKRCLVGPGIEEQHSDDHCLGHHDLGARIVGKGLLKGFHLELPATRRRSAPARCVRN